MDSHALAIIMAVFDAALEGQVQVRGTDTVAGVDRRKDKIMVTLSNGDVLMVEGFFPDGESS